MIETERLILRNWKDLDRNSFFELNSDPRVMEFMPRLLTRAESDAFIDKTIQLIDKRGHELWAIEQKDNAQFIGFTGLNPPTWKAHFTPCVEVSWRLDYGAWGKERDSIDLYWHYWCSSHGLLFSSQRRI